jgi:hypothetical protein
MTWVGLRRLVAMGVTTSMTLTGCSSSSIHYALPELRDRSSQMTRITFVTVDVRARRLRFQSEDFPREWAETARTNLSNAIAKSFGNDPRVVVTPFDSNASQAARQELEQVRDAMASIRPRRIEARDCLPGPVLALANAAGTDTLLLAYARETIETAGARAVTLGISVVLAPVLLLAALFYGVDVFRENPDRRIREMNAIALCLVDARQGDILWFDLRFLDNGSLLDASDVDRLIGTAYVNFREVAHP